MLGYLDPGTGSMIVGAVAAGAAGVGVAVRTGLSKFRRSPKQSSAVEASGTGQDQDGAGGNNAEA
ncbi:MAG: hypothetical protein HYX32_02525 [Actinobacteria bacterium]|nr:hypothetical protein [Actinomycetota bacterium]